MSAAGPRILVILFGRLGDTLMRLPLVRALRDRYPDATIEAVCDTVVADALAPNPLFAAVHPLRRRGTSYREQARFYLALRRCRFDIVVDMYFGARTPLMAWLTGAGKRLGMANYWYGKLLMTDLTPSPLPQVHMVDRHLPLLEPLGITSMRRVWEFPVAASHVATLEAQLAAAGLADLPGPSDLVVAIGAGNVTKRLHEDVLDEVLTAVNAGALGVPRRVLLVGDLQEPRLAERWRGREGIVVLPTLPLPELGALFSRVGLVMTPDAGPMHIALATAPRFLTYFQSTHPHWHDATRPAYRFLYRENCPVQPCDTRLAHTCHHECRRSLTAEDVLQAMAGLFGEPAWDGVWPANRVTLADVRAAAASQ